MAHRAEAANHAKSEFLANMSHEIRTPMTAILGYTDVMLEETSDVRRRDQLTTIKRNADHLLSLINDILDLSKIEANKIVLEAVRSSPHEIVAEVASLLQVRVQEKKLEFRTEFIGTIPEKIDTDPLRVRQILMNLLGNAIKFTKEGGVRLLVRQINIEDEPYLQFDVIDTGIGMTPEQGDRIFEPFMQADSSTTRRFGGTGLGLSISRRLAELLGGGIELVDSKEGIGTRFRLTIPTGPLEGVRLIEGTSNNLEITLSTAKGPERQAPPSSKPLEDVSVLLVEDSPDNQLLISHLLKKAGATVDMAANGKIGFEKARSLLERGESYDVILMDMQMPVMGGYEATSRLRKAGYTKPIIALTANAMAEDRQKCLDAGCDEYATKPIRREELISKVLAARGAATASM